MNSIEFYCPTNPVNSGNILPFNWNFSEKLEINSNCKDSFVFWGTNSHLIIINDTITVCKVNLQNQQMSLQIIHSRKMPAPVKSADISMDGTYIAVVGVDFIPIVRIFKLNFVNDHNIRIHYQSVVLDDLAERVLWQKNPTIKDGNLLIVSTQKETHYIISESPILHRCINLTRFSIVYVHHSVGEYRGSIFWWDLDENPNLFFYPKDDKDPCIWRIGDLGISHSDIISSTSSISICGLGKKLHSAPSLRLACIKRDSEMILANTKGKNSFIIILRKIADSSSLVKDRYELVTSLRSITNSPPLRIVQCAYSNNIVIIDEDDIPYFCEIRGDRIYRASKTSGKWCRIQTEDQIKVIKNGFIIARESGIIYLNIDGSKFELPDIIGDNQELIKQFRIFDGSLIGSQCDPIFLIESKNVQGYALVNSENFKFEPLSLNQLDFLNEIYIGVFLILTKNMKSSGVFFGLNKKYELVIYDANFGILKHKSVINVENKTENIQPVINIFGEIVLLETIDCNNICHSIVTFTPSIAFDDYYEKSIVMNFIEKPLFITWCRETCILIATKIGLFFYKKYVDIDGKIKWENIIFRNWPSSSFLIPFEPKTIQVFIDCLNKIWVLADGCIFSFAPLEQDSFKPNKSMFILKDNLIKTNEANMLFMKNSIEKVSNFNLKDLNDEIKTSDCVNFSSSGLEFSFFDIDPAKLFNSDDENFTDNENRKFSPSISNLEFDLDLPGKVYILYSKLSEWGASKSINFQSFQFLAARMCDSQEVLINITVKESSCLNNYEKFRQMGLGFWVKNPLRMQELIESVAKSDFTLKKDPRICTILYCLLKKTTALRILWKNTNYKMATFLESDFDQLDTKSIAIKNAFAAMSKQDYLMSIIFFLLSSKYIDAIKVCLEKLNDFHMAFMIARYSAFGMFCTSQLSKKIT